MLTTLRPLSEMSSLKLVLTAFSTLGSRSDIGPIPSAGAGQLGSSLWMMVFASVGMESEVPRGRREFVLRVFQGGRKCRRV
jgi:hypothetical protein